MEERLAYLILFLIDSLAMGLNEDKVVWPGLAGVVDAGDSQGISKRSLGLRKDEQQKPDSRLFITYMSVLAR